MCRTENVSSVGDERNMLINTSRNADIILYHDSVLEESTARARARARARTGTTSDIMSCFLLHQRNERPGPDPIAEA